MIDPFSGELLALTNQPVPDFGNGAPVDSESLLDRARYGLYPPGSIFKVITAMAALKSSRESVDTAFECVRLPGGRVGNTVRGQIVRDDVTDRAPHGLISMEKALARSCNAYFAQLGSDVVGAERLNIRHGRSVSYPHGSPNTPGRLNAFLPQASYGQGEVLVSPLQMARVAATVGNNGHNTACAIYSTNKHRGGGYLGKPQVLDIAEDQELARYMRSVVTSGTAFALNKFPLLASRGRPDRGGRRGVALVVHGIRALRKWTSWPDRVRRTRGEWRLRRRVLQQACRRRRVGGARFWVSSMNPWILRRSNSAFCKEIGRQDLAASICPCSRPCENLKVVLRRSLNCRLRF